MKKLTIEKLMKIKGGGCNRWARRADRTNDEDIKYAYLNAFEECIANKYR